MILVGFSQTVLLDSLEIYYSSHPHTPWKSAPLDPQPLEFPEPLNGGGGVWMFTETTYSFFHEGVNGVNLFLRLVDSFS